MKKRYEKPVADKIAFRYQDQVVAASGDVSVEHMPENNSQSSPEQFIEWIAEGLGISACSNFEFECSSLLF